MNIYSQSIITSLGMQTMLSPDTEIMPVFTQVLCVQSALMIFALPLSILSSKFPFDPFKFIFVIELPDLKVSINLFL